MARTKERAANGSAAQSGNPVAQVSGSVLCDLDALAQQCVSEIEVLVNSAIDSLALDAGALTDVRTLLLMVSERAQVLADGINGAAEDCGCNFVDETARGFADTLRAQECR